MKIQYGVYNSKKIIETPNFSDIFEHIVDRFKGVGLSCDPNNQLNVCTTSETEGDVVHA